MSCNNSTIHKSRTVFTDRTTTGQFVPLHQGSALKNALFKMDYNLEENQGSMEVKRAIRYSNDGGVTWSAATEFGTYSSSTGWDFHDSFETISDDYSAFQIGLMTKNASGTGQGIGRIDATIALAAASR